MKRYLSASLVLANILAVAVLIALWVAPDGRLRNSDWQPPAAVKPDLSVPSLPQPDMNLVRFVAMLEKPLFSPSRQPPPIKPAAPAAPPPDPLANISLYGVYIGPDGGGIIARVDGKSRRLRLNENVGDWTVKEVKDRDVTFSRGDEQRVVHLAHSRLVRSPDPAPAPAPGGSSANEGQPPSMVDAKQKMIEEERARLARRNALRAKAGLPPVE